MKIIISKRKFYSPVAWGINEGDGVNGEIVLSLYITLHTGFHFSVRVANASFNGKNPIDCIMRALEHESVGMHKYERIKERTRENGTWKRL